MLDLTMNSHLRAGVDQHPARGASWETFVVEDILRREAVAHPNSQAYFWRTAAGAEVDLVIERLADNIARGGFQDLLEGVPE